MTPKSIFPLLPIAFFYSPSSLRTNILWLQLYNESYLRHYEAIGTQNYRARVRFRHILLQSRNNNLPPFLCTNITNTRLVAVTADTGGWKLLLPAGVLLLMIHIKASPSSGSVNAGFRSMNDVNKGALGYIYTHPTFVHTPYLPLLHLS